MLLALIKIVLYGILAYIIYHLVRFFRVLSKAKKSSQPLKHPSGIMVKDEICNTYLPKEDALKETYQGKEYYFCSNECRQKFLEGEKIH